jgi:hypothetical protein
VIPLATLVAALMGMLTAASPMRRGSAAFPASLVALMRTAAMAQRAFTVLNGSGSFAGLLAVVCL